MKCCFWASDNIHSYCYCIDIVVAITRIVVVGNTAAVAVVVAVLSCRILTVLMILVVIVMTTAATLVSSIPMWDILMRCSLKDACYPAWKSCPQKTFGNTPTPTKKKPYGTTYFPWQRRVDDRLAFFGLQDNIRACTNL